MRNRLKSKIAYLYVFFIAMALLHGVRLIRKACDYREADPGYAKKEVVLENGALRLVFSNGYITAHCGQLQFTENSGVACFFSVKGIPYASFKGVWEIEKISQVELSAASEWPGLPIKQNWHFSLKDGKISWQVNLESSEDIVINHIGLVFSFKDIYRKWASFYEHGEMPVLDVLQQKQNINSQFALNPLGLVANGKEKKYFSAIGLNFKEDVFLKEVLLSSRRDMFSKAMFSCVSIGGEEALKIHKNEKIILSSGEACIFNKQKELSEYFIEVKTDEEQLSARSII